MSSNDNVKEQVEVEVGSKKDAGAAEVESGAAVVKIDESVRNQGKENNDGSSSEALLPTSSAQVLQRRNRKIKIKLKGSSHQSTVRGNHDHDDGNKAERVSKANRVRRNSRRRRQHYCKHHNARQNGNFVLIRSHALPVVYDLHKVNTKRHSCRAYSSSPAGERKGSLEGSRKFLLFTFTPHPSCSTACHPPPSLNPHTNNTSRCCSCRCCSRRREARRVREGLKMTPQTGQEGEVKSGARSKLVRPELPVSKNGMDGGHSRSPNNDDDASNLKSKRESAERSPDPRRGSKRKKKHKHHHHRSCSSSSSTASSSVHSRSPSSHNGDEDEDETGRVLETSRKKSKKLKKTKRHHHHHHHHRRHSHRSREGRERKRNKSKAKKKKKRRRRSRSRAKSKDDKVKNGSSEKTNEPISCCHHPCDKSEEDEGIKKEAPKETDSSAMNIIAVQPDKCNDAPSEPDKLSRKDEPGAKETQLEMFILGLSNGKGKKSPTRLRPLENGIVLELRDPDEESVCSSSSVRSKARFKSHSRSRSKSRSRSYTRSRSRSPHYDCSPGAVSHRSSRSHSLSYRSRSHSSSSSYHHRSFSSRSSSYCSERSRKRSHHGSSTTSSYSSRSRSRSRTSSRSRSPSSRSRSRSSSVRRSRSRSRSKSRSVSRSKSRSRTRSKSRTKSRSKSRTKSRSKSRTKSRSRSKTRSKSRSKTRKRSRSIPRRRGSPSFLDRRRITSARKRPIPYKRKPGSEWENSSDSSDSSS